MSFARKSQRLSLPVLNDDPRSWDVRVFATLFRFNSRMERRMAEALAPHGLTVAQMDVLATLCCGDGITQQELAEWLLVTKGNIVGLIDRVSAAGWVERRPDPEDRRVNRLYLTDAARKLMAEVEPGQAALMREIFGKLTEEELRQLHGLLQRLDAACTENG
jgi:DNA-binding MarR family transcriptional regulator